STAFLPFIRALPCILYGGLPIFREVKRMKFPKLYPQFLGLYNFQKKEKRAVQAAFTAEEQLCHQNVYSRY
ncbi:hypothetical protein, partial [Paenibacillus harenae]|uniref:hypothetical protein n=1 Tax=Paenibacillus harenae TaxID=306543 RepID=UPI001B7FEF63